MYTREGKPALLILEALNFIHFGSIHPSREGCLKVDLSEPEAAKLRYC